MSYTQLGPGDFDPPEPSPCDELKAELEELRARALRAIRAAFASGYRAAMYDELYEAGGATDRNADDCDCPEDYLDEVTP